MPKPFRGGSDFRFENNVSQQEAIVREAFKEFNRRGNVDKVCVEKV